MDEFEIDEIQVMTLVNKLRENGNNVVIDSKNGILYIHNLCQRNVDFQKDYSIPLEDPSSFKVLVISDTRLCSKYEQLSYLNSLYSLAAKELSLSEEEIYGAVELLKAYGKNIDIIERNDKFIISKRNYYGRKTNQDMNDYSEEKHYKVGLIGDTHLCTKYGRLNLVNDFYKRAVDSGVHAIFHCGDLTDGYYGDHRPEQNYELIARGFDEQAEYILDYYPQVDGIKTYFIQGNHDFSHERNDGATLGKWISRSSNDLVYLGQDKALIPPEELGNVKFMIEHPDDGCGKFYSYALQKNIEALPSGNKPVIYACGHYHKYYYAFYRNVHGFMVPCMCAPSAFISRKHLSSTAGGLILDIYADEKGHIGALSCEEIIYDDKMIENEDYKVLKRKK